MQIFKTKQKKAFFISRVADTSYLLLDTFFSIFPHPTRKKRRSIPLSPQPSVDADGYGELAADDSVEMAEIANGDSPFFYNDPYGKKGGVGTHIEPHSVVFAFLDCGIGYGDEKTENDVFNCINKKLQEFSSEMFVIWSNSDNPSWFGQSDEKWSNIHFIKELSVVQCQEKNILCISGGFKYNRSWYVSRGVSYCLSLPNLEMDEISAFLEDNSIDSVISYFTPSFVEPSMGNMYGLKKWEKADPALYDDIKKIRYQMDNLYITLSTKRMPSSWAFMGIEAPVNPSVRSSYNSILFLSTPPNIVSDLFVVQKEEKIIPF